MLFRSPVTVSVHSGDPEQAHLDFRDSAACGWRFVVCGLWLVDCGWHMSDKCASSLLASQSHIRTYAVDVWWSLVRYDVVGVCDVRQRPRIRILIPF